MNPVWMPFVQTSFCFTQILPVRPGRWAQLCFGHLSPAGKFSPQSAAATPALRPQKHQHPLSTSAQLCSPRMLMGKALSTALATLCTALLLEGTYASSQGLLECRR